MWLLKPIATHEYLNVRTYVRHGAETGIYFLAEWLPNRLSVALGPRFFGLPYRLDRFDYHELSCSNLRTNVADGFVSDGFGKGLLTFNVRLEPNSAMDHCDAGSLEEWLMERYAAFFVWFVLATGALTYFLSKRLQKSISEPIVQLAKTARMLTSTGVADVRPLRWTLYLDLIV